MRHLFPAFVLLALPHLTWAQTQPAFDLHNPPAVAALVKDLSSDDFATRDRAQRLLEQIPLSARDDLAKLVTSTADPEAKSRLLSRLDELDDLRATTAPPLSVNLKDASLAQVAAALSTATGLTFINSSSPANAADRFTLKADNLSFWEIHRQLAAQNPLWYSMGVNQIQFYHDTNNKWCDTSITRGIAVFLQDLKAPPAPRPGAAATTAKYTSTLGLGIDPRLSILQIKPPEIAPLTDDNNTRWTATPTSTFITTVSLGHGIAYTRPISIEPAAATVGKTFPSLRGTFPLVVQSTAESKTFDPAKDPLNKPFVLGNTEITLTKCQITPGTPNANIDLDLAVRIAPGKDANGTPYPLGPITVYILDSAGKTVLTRTLPLGFTGTMSNALNTPATTPLTIRLDVTASTREVQIPFEFKNVPIP